MPRFCAPLGDEVRLLDGCWVVDFFVALDLDGEALVRLGWAEVALLDLPPAVPAPAAAPGDLDDVDAGRVEARLSEELLRLE